MAKAKRAETSIKAGSYAINQGITPLQLLDKLLQGKVSLGQLTWLRLTIRQWRDKINSSNELTHETRGLTDRQIAEQIGLKRKSRRVVVSRYLFV